MRPAHFIDQHTQVRQRWLRDLQAPQRRVRTIAAEYALNVVAIALVLLIAALWADGLTGEHYIGELVRQARVTT